MQTSADRVLRAIERAAAADLPCPSNIDISNMLGAASPSCGPRMLSQLVRRGLITVRRGANVRVVTILATGKKTAGEIKSPHWRDVKSRVPSHSHHASPPAAPAQETLSAPVRRDPCPRCGARGDAGCGHHASRLVL